MDVNSFLTGRSLAQKLRFWIVVYCLTKQHSFIVIDQFEKEVLEEQTGSQGPHGGERYLIPIHTDTWTSAHGLDGAFRTKSHATVGGTWADTIMAPYSPALLEHEVIPSDGK